MPDLSAPPPNLLSRIPPPVAGPRILPPSMIQSQQFIPPPGAQPQLGNPPPFASSSYQYQSTVPPQVGGSGIHGAPVDRPPFGFHPPFRGGGGGGGGGGPGMMPQQNMGPTWEKPT